MSLKLYIDRLSQPCRAIEIFLKVNNISYTPKLIKIGEGQQKTPEFAKINPFKLLPVIEHNGNNIIESIAILRYLCREYNVPDHWYPKDSLRQARVDEYLEWHQTGTRAKAVEYLWMKILGPLRGTGKYDEKSIENARKATNKMCDQLSNIWLKDKPFLNSQEISIADILAACELEQLKMCNFDPLDGRPNLSDWMQRVKDKTNPAYDETHVTFFKFVSFLNSRSKM